MRRHAAAALLSVASAWVGCLPAAHAPEADVAIVQAPIEDLVEVGPPSHWTPSSALPFDVPVWIDSRFSDDERADLVLEEQAWERATGGCVRFVAGDEVQVLRVDGTDEFPPGLTPGSIAFWSSAHARMWVAPQAVCSTLAPTCTLARRMIFMHELGHVLGLPHSDASGSCMHALEDWRCDVDAVPWVDAWAFCSAHGGCACGR